MQKREYILMICLVVGLMVLMPFRFRSVPKVTPVMETLLEPSPEPAEPPQEQVMEPRIEEYWIDTNGAWGSVFVTVERSGFEPACAIKLSVWTSDHATVPFQTLDFVGDCLQGPQVIDANFDGYSDFIFLCSQENGTEYCHLWTWNEWEGRFENHPDFVQIPNPQFDTEAQRITGRIVQRNGCGRFVSYRWSMHALRCEVDIEAEELPEGNQLTVYDGDGEMLLRKAYTDERGDTDTVAAMQEEQERWEQTGYSGEIYGKPIDNTHDAFLINTRGKKGALLVTVKWKAGQAETDAAARLDFSVWDPADMEKPIQTMEADSDYFHQETIWDVNFDGYPDFSYLAFSSSHGNDCCNTWRWDEAEGKFVEVPEFRRIHRPELDAEKELIWGTLASLPCTTYVIYRWQGNELHFLRSISWEYIDNETKTFCVKDRTDGEWRTLYETSVSGDEKIDIRWYDPDYYGAP